MSAAARPLDLGAEAVTSLSLVRRSRAPVIAGLVTCIAAVLAIGPWPVGIFQDDGIYVILAKSLATGEGYRYLNLPGAPNATHFPPGYPLLLALLWKASPAFPANVALFKFANAALLGLAAAAACRFAMTRLAWGPVVALVTVLLFTVCAHVLLIGVTVMSEPLFLVLLFASLLSAERAVEEPSWRNVLVATLVGALLAYVRTLGLLVCAVTSLAVGAAVAVGVHLATREPQSGWAVAVGADSFVVLDERGTPSEVCTVEVGETHCHPVQRTRDMRRRTLQRWREEGLADLKNPPAAL